MRLSGVDFPNELIQAAKLNELVVFAGAGVSMGEPANLPSFWKLANKIAIGTGRSPYDPVDRFLGELLSSKANVHSIASNILDKDDIKPTELHMSLLQLFSDTHNVKVVTTNFDLLFEMSAYEIWSNSPEVFSAPALPLGKEFSGIVHVHGSIKKEQSMVLTDIDFGRAYLTEGWARRFLVDLFARYSVLFVGYSHDDTVMQYLARALPSKTIDHRFVLIGCNESPDKWNLLGIKPITYYKENDNDYSLLYSCVAKLQETLRRTQINWKDEISQIASLPPPDDIEDADLIRHAMEDISKVRYFTDSARDPDWLLWLESEGYLTGLFTSENLNEIEKELCRWLTENFTISNTNYVFILIGKHHNELSYELWWNLARTICIDDSEQEFAKWVILLLEIRPANPDIHMLHRLAEKSDKLNLDNLVLLCFKVMAETRTIIKEPYQSELLDEQENKARFELGIRSPHFNINEIWEKCLKPKIEILHHRIIDLCTEILSKRNLLSTTLLSTDGSWDLDNFRRSAIEPHEQDDYPEAIDIIVDACRDALEYLTVNAPNDAFIWVKDHLYSKSILLQRLAIHILCINSSITENEKITLILEMGIHNTRLRHEIFTLLKKVYPSTDNNFRKKLVDEIMEYKWVDENESNAEKRTAYERFLWLSWLLDSDPQCKILKKEIEPITKKYPKIKAREYPDLTSWTGSDWQGPESPYTVTQLLEKNTDDWFKELVQFQGDNFMGPSREGLRISVSDAAKKDFSWVVALSEYLKANSLWESDLWAAIINSFSVWPDSENKAHQIILLFSESSLQNNFAREIAEVICSLIKNEKVSYRLSMLSDLNKIAKSLWENTPQTQFTSETHNWFESAINSTEGKITEYWIFALSLHIKNNPRELVEPFKNELTKLCDASESKTQYSIPVICHQLSFLSSIDSKWANENVVSYFRSDDISRFQQAWDGVLSNHRFTPAVFEILEEFFLHALPKIANEQEERIDRFVDFYTAAIFWYVENPLADWIPKLFGSLSQQHHPTFTKHAHHIIRGLKSEKKLEVWQKWLKEYWINRINGIPSPLSDSEIRSMLEWLADLSEVFEDAARIAIKMHHCELHQSHLIYSLNKDSELLAKYPESTANLVLYLLSCTGPTYCFTGIEEIVSNLFDTNLNQDLKTELKDALIARGFKLPELVK